MLFRQDSSLLHAKIRNAAFKKTLCCESAHSKLIFWKEKKCLSVPQNFPAWLQIHFTMCSRYMLMYKVMIVFEIQNYPKQILCQHMCLCVVFGYHYGGTCCFLKLEAAGSSKIMVATHWTTWYHNSQDYGLNLHYYKNITFYILQHVHGVRYVAWRGTLDFLYLPM
jgi:hypothetical protein